VKKDDMSVPEGFVTVQTVTTSKAEVLRPFRGHLARRHFGLLLLDRVIPIVGST
jgi:hypothetical protein